MKEKSEFQTPKKKSLLRKYEIPVDHLDFRYLESCTDVVEVERILKILRSGEEGHYPELEQFAASKLRQLAPTSRVLRVEVPVLKSESLGKDELQALEAQFLAWTSKPEEHGDGDTFKTKSKVIFGSSDLELDFEKQVRRVDDVDSCESVPPIRFTKLEKTEGTMKTPTALTSTAQNSDRIKSWDYDKWDKFDADAELTKLEVEDMKKAEFDLSKHRKQVLKEQQQVIEKLMKNQDPEDINVLIPAEVKRRLNAKKSINCRPSSSKMVQGFDAGMAGNAEDSDVPLLEDCESLIRQSCSKRSERLDVNEKSISEKSFVIKEALNEKRSKRNVAATSSKVSLVEEIADERQEVVKQQQSKTGDIKPKRRFKIQIEDLNVRY